MDPSTASSSAAPPNNAQEPMKEEDLCIAFDTYPWSKDTKFMVRTCSPRVHHIAPYHLPSCKNLSLCSHQLAQSLIQTSLQKPSPTPEAKIRHARTAYFTRILGFPLSPESYAAFLASHPSHTPPDAFLLAIVQGVPAWQVAAPKADLFVDKITKESGDGPSYPGRFAELIRCIKEGTPVPGVREIPDTILRDPVGLPPIIYLVASSV